MKTYYPYRAAAKYAGVSRRTIYRWVSQGYMIGKGRIRLRAEFIGSRLCIEERHLNAFLAARRKYLETQRKWHEKFTVH